MWLLLFLPCCRHLARLPAVPSIVLPLPLTLFLLSPLTASTDTHLVSSPSFSLTFFPDSKETSLCLFFVPSVCNPVPFLFVFLVHDVIMSYISRLSIVRVADTTIQYFLSHMHARTLVGLSILRLNRFKSGSKNQTFLRCLIARFSWTMCEQRNVNVLHATASLLPQPSGYHQSNASEISRHDLFLPIQNRTAAYQKAFATGHTQANCSRRKAIDIATIG